MGNYFEMIKEQTQIVKALESSETEDESSFALKRLRPREILEQEGKGKSLKFKDLINRENHHTDQMKYENRNYKPVVIIKGQSKISEIKYLPQNVLLRRQHDKKMMESRLREKQMSSLLCEGSKDSPCEETKRRLLEKTTQKEGQHNISYRDQN